MHENHTYNLLEQLVTEQKSLWRIKNAYPKDSCENCQKVWDSLAASKEQSIQELTDQLKAHLG